MLDTYFPKDPELICHRCGKIFTSKKQRNNHGNIYYCESDK